MLRLLLQLLALTALLLAPIPAAAIPAAPGGQAAGHCTESSPSSDHHEEKEQDGDEQPCCKGSMSCSPLAAGFAEARPSAPALVAGPAPCVATQSMRRNPALAPLTEPPTLD